MHQSPLERHFAHGVPTLRRVRVLGLAAGLVQNGGVIGLEFRPTSALLGEANPAPAIFGFTGDDCSPPTLRTFNLRLSETVLVFERGTGSNAVPMAPRPGYKANNEAIFTMKTGIIFDGFLGNFVGELEGHQ